MLPFILLLASHRTWAHSPLAWFNPPDPHPIAAALGLAVAKSVSRRAAAAASGLAYVIARARPGSLSEWLSSGVARPDIVPPHAPRDWFLVTRATASDASGLSLCTPPTSRCFSSDCERGRPAARVEPGGRVPMRSSPAGRSASGCRRVAAVAGLRMPEHVTWRDLIVAGLATSVAFSVGLFVSGALVPAGQLRAELSMGVLMSLLAAPLALAAARILRVGRFAASYSSR